MIEPFESCRLEIQLLQQKYGMSVWSKCLAQLRKEKRTVDKPLKRLTIPHKVRLELYAHQQGKCANVDCQESILISQMEVDHIQSLASGGRNIRSNYRGLCKKCNKQKGGNDLLRESKRVNQTFTQMLGGN